MLRICIPGDPIAKGRPRFTRQGHAYTPAKTARAERSIAQFAAEAMVGRRLYDEPLAVIIDCAFLWPKSTTKKRRADPSGIWKTTKPDWDNCGKIIDALNKVVWVDDGQICLALVRKYLSDRPGTTIWIYPVSEALEAFPWLAPPKVAAALSAPPQTPTLTPLEALLQ